MSGAIPEYPYEPVELTDSAGTAYWLRDSSTDFQPTARGVLVFAPGPPADAEWLGVACGGAAFQVPLS